MGLSPVLWVEVSQLQPQHRTGPNLKFIDNVKPWHQYRGSGLVHWLRAVLPLSENRTWRTTAIE
jgi:hypothetical protein